MDQSIHFCLTEDGANIAYAEVGQGPPLVKAANWLSHLEFDWQSPVWRHWLTGLSKNRRLIRYDERGCGLSDWDTNEFSLEAWVQDLEAVVEAAELDHFPLLGISQGGPVAICYAALHPEKVSHLILYGTYARGRMHRNPDDEKRQEIELFYDMIRLGWGKSNPAFRQAFTGLFIPEASEEQMHWFNDLQQVSTTPENAVQFRKAFSNINITELATQVAVPTLVLHPKDDAVVPFEEGRLLATLIPGAQFVPLEGRNHILLESEPAWSHFLEAVHNFLGSPASMTSKSAPRHNPSAAMFVDLTQREREVLELMALGYRNDEIAQKLVLSPKTIRNYTSIIFSKLDVSSRGEAIVRAREAGFGQ
jgi:pimeloyl-ACP methyl ester carboxylesterase/DNA-binding CsgD family transcriptional regulator